MLRRRRARSGQPQYELGRAAVYSRVSSPGDTREASLETQEEAITARLREQGYEVGDHDVFRDKFTGKETIRRPQLNRLRELVRQGVYRAVGVYKLDRLARNMGHSFILLGEMDELKVRPLSVCEPDIDNSPQGKMYRMMGSYMAEAELANLEDRFGRGREHIEAKGLPLGRGGRAYGLNFDKKTRTYSHDEDEPDRQGTARWARQIFAMAAEGHSGHAIAERLNSLGVLPPGLARGFKYTKRDHVGRWSARVVLNIIRNPIYKGWVSENKFYSEGVTDAGHSIMRRVPEEEWVTYDKTGRIAPPLVDETTWEAANRTIDENARNVNSAAKKVHDHLLRGMIYCSCCGAKRYGYRNRHGNTVYRCANHTLVVQKRKPESSRCTSAHVRGAWIEPRVWELLKEQLVTPGAIKRAVLRALAEYPRDGSEGELALARANLAEHERMREKWFRKWRDEESRPEPDAETAAKWEAEYRALKGPIESLKRTVETLEKRVAALVSPEVIAARVEEKLEGVCRRLLLGEEFTEEEKREALLMAQTKVIVVGNGRRKEGLAGGSGTVTFFLFNVFEEGIELGSFCA
jgi:DNA invertase Pin-like site-specific DNA recombinase